MFSGVAALLLLAAQLPPSVGLPQQQAGVEVVGTDVSPASFSTGEVVELIIDLRVPRGVRLQLPDTLTYLQGGGAAGVGRREEAPHGSSQVEGRSLRLIYPLQFFRPGAQRLPPLRIGVQGMEEGAEGEYRWISLPLDPLRVLAVIPPTDSNPLPASARRLSGGNEGVMDRAGRLALGASLGLGLLGWFLRRRRGRTPDGPRRRAPSIPGAQGPSPAEARRRLERILTEDLKGLPHEGLRWEEALLLCRLILLAGLDQDPGGQTTPEILGALGTEGGVPLVSVFLEEGDRMRFGGRPVSPAQASDTLTWVSRWLDGPHA